jgi:hypothetical protein
MNTGVWYDSRVCPMPYEATRATRTIYRSPCRREPAAANPPNPHYPTMVHALQPCTPERGARVCPGKVLRKRKRGKAKGSAPASGKGSAPAFGKGKTPAYNADRLRATDGTGVQVHGVPSPSRPSPHYVCAARVRRVFYLLTLGRGPRAGHV